MSRLNRTTLLVILLATSAACASRPIPLHGELGADEVPASIVLPEQLEIVTVNGLEVEGAGGLLSKGDTTLEVSPGRYEVVAFYRELWERGDQHDMLRSDPALFVVYAAAGQRYRFDYVRPATLSEARALAADFHGWVEATATGARTPSTPSGLRFRRGLVAAATFDDTLVPVAPVSGSGQQVAPLPPADPQTLVAPPASAAPVAPGPGNPPPVETPLEDEPWLDLMKGWWNEASAEERREFLRWVGERR